VELSTIAPYVVFPANYPTAINEVFKPPFWQNMLPVGILNTIVIFPSKTGVEKFRDDALTYSALGIQQLEKF